MVVSDPLPPSAISPPREGETRAKRARGSLKHHFELQISAKALAPISSLHVGNTEVKSRRFFGIHKGAQVMSEWTFAQSDRADELAHLHFFSINKRQGDEIIEFRITVKEYATPNHLSMRFYAEADRQTNQRTVPYTPSGWGQTLLQALSDCVKAIQRFPYEGD